MSKTEAPALSENQNWLRQAERRLRALNLDAPGSAEVTRLEGVVADIRSRLTAEELDTYSALTTKTLTAEEKRAAAAAEAKAMEANRDKPSI